MSKTILVVAHNHFDPTWRRCFDRTAVRHGTTVRSYAEIEERCIDGFLALAPSDCRFSEGQAAVWRKYLERNPGKRQQLRDAAGAGALDVMLAGETVQDTALPTAEGLVRNFLVAWPFYRDFVGLDHRGLRLAWLEDAFGNSPNYPQVLLGVGAEVACGLSYRKLPEDRWVGIDGSGIICYDRVPFINVGGYEKQPPCPACSGAGCPECAGSGIAWITGFDLQAVRAALDKAAAQAGDVAVVWMTTEEGLPDPAIAAVIAEFNRGHGGSAVARLANPGDVYDAFGPALRAGVAGRGPEPSIDLNPAMPGCMVSRIRTKQRTRAVAYKLLAAESLIATSAWNAGRPIRQPDDLTQAWRHVAFNQFHDAITGTHIDHAYAELMDMLDAAERVADARLPAPAMAAQTPWTVVDGATASEQSLGRFTLTYDRCGIIAINAPGAPDLFGQLPPISSKRRRGRIAELVLQSDFGDAWGQRIACFAAPDDDATTIWLGDFNESVERGPDAIRWRGRYHGGDPKVKKLAWTVTARISADGARIEFTSEVDWDTESRRLRVIIPVASRKPAATYEVPFGFIDRAWQPEKLDFSQWQANQLEYPTLHWVRAAITDDSGVVLFNKGLPCNRWIPGRLDLSLLRSPEWAFCAVEPKSYEFWDIDGQRDTGSHRLEYALLPYWRPITPGGITRMGYAYNLPGPLAPPFAITGDVVVTAWKPAEDGEGWILRLQEAGGAGTTVTCDFGANRDVIVTDLLERPRSPREKTAHFSHQLHRHGILTLRIR